MKRICILTEVIVLKKTKSRKLILSVIGGLAASCAIIGTIAFLSSYDEVANVFKGGNVSIILSEPDYPGDTSPEVTAVAHNAVVDKNPQITNNGDNGTYVFLRVTVPLEKITELKPDGTAMDKQIVEGVVSPLLQELFYMKIQDQSVNDFTNGFHNTEWIELKQFAAGGSYNESGIWSYDSDAQTRTYLFGYYRVLEPGKKTDAPLFDQVQLKNMKEQFLFSNFLKQINIEALGIQSDALEGIDTSQPMNEEKLSAIFRLIDE